MVGLEPVTTKLRETGHDPDSGLEAGVISEADRARLAEMEDLVARVIAVDDFTPDELARLYPGARNAAATDEGASDEQTTRQQAAHSAEGVGQ